MKLWLAINLGVILCPPIVWAEDYYQPPKSCKRSVSSHSQLPIDPLQFLAPVIQNQGETPSCGFHAGTIALEALTNSQNNQRTGLSVVHAMEHLGVCDKSQFESKATSTVPFLLKMRSSPGIRPFEKTVHEHFTGLCTQNPSGFEGLTNNIDRIASTLIFDKSNQPAIPIPPYNIETWDFQRNEDPGKLAEDLFSEFKKQKPLPVVFSSCFRSVNGTCEDFHAIVLIGIEKVSCDDGTVQYTGIYKNSWGEETEKYDLKEMLQGMVKHQGSAVFVHTCKGPECLDPPLLARQNSNPVYHLAEAGNLNGIKTLQGLGTNLDKPGTWRTPLNIAAREGHLEVVKYLVEQGADMNKATNEGWTPLYTAAGKGHLEVVKFLVEHGADKDEADDEGFTPLSLAVRLGHLEVAKFLVEHGANKDKGNRSGFTPLIIAVAEGHLEKVKFLVEHGADKDKADYEGFTPLNVAVGLGHLEVVKYLVEQGADMNKANSDGIAPLHTAADGGHLEVVKYLVEHGADKEKTSEVGSTPLKYAATKGLIEIVRYLVEQGADKDKPDRWGETPLWVATENGHLETVKYLIKKGANPLVLTRDGKSILEIAKKSSENQAGEVVKLIEDYIQRYKQKK